MSLKETMILGAVGAAALIAARKVPAIGDLMDPFESNGQALPVIGVAGPMVKNGWSAIFWVAPAVGAYFLSK